MAGLRLESWFPFLWRMAQMSISGAGYAKDAEKYPEAMLTSWTVIRLSEKQLELEFIARTVALLQQSSSSEETICGRNRRTE